jgi:uncharacterized membrane protein required for colicin V production
MTVLDLITAGIILICVLFCTWKGILLSLFNLFSLFITFMLTRQLYPLFAGFLEKTPLFRALKQAALGWMGPASESAGQAVREAAENLALPEIFKKILLENFDFNGSLDIAVVYENISSYIASMVINALAILIVFFTVFILMRVIAAFLRVVSRMPVVKTFNRIGGAVMGLAIGAIFSWLTLSVMQGIFSSNIEFPVMDLLAESLVARFFIFSL